MLVFICRDPGDTTRKFHAPCTPLKISLPENETMVNLKSASVIVIMLLREGLTNIHSQI